MSITKFCAVALTAVSLAGVASAATLPDSIQGLASPGSYSADYLAPAAGAYLASFDIRGYQTLDGNNGQYEDDFTLTVNGVNVFSGTFNLGGGGVSQWSPTVASVAVSNPNGPYDGKAAGGTARISNLPISLKAGANKIVFSYDSPTNGGLYGGGLSGPQGTGDESFGIQNINISAAPEPAAWSLMMIGVGGLGAALRTRRRLAPAKA